MHLVEFDTPPSNTPGDSPAALFDLRANDFSSETRPGLDRASTNCDDA
jgi:hypothetical protein